MVFGAVAESADLKNLSGERAKSLTQRGGAKRPERNRL